MLNTKVTETDSRLLHRQVTNAAQKYHSIMQFSNTLHCYDKVTEYTYSAYINPHRKIFITLQICLLSNSTYSTSSLSEDVLN